MKEKENIKELIQVCYNIDSQKTKNRETRSLLKASDKLGCGNLSIITYDYEGKEEIEGKTVNFKPVWKWLLE